MYLKYVFCNTVINVPTVSFALVQFNASLLKKVHFLIYMFAYIYSYTHPNEGGVSWRGFAAVGVSVCADGTLKQIYHV